MQSAGRSLKSEADPEERLAVAISSLTSAQALSACPRVRYLGSNSKYVGTLMPFDQGLQTSIRLGTAKRGRPVLYASSPIVGMCAPLLFSSPLCAIILDPQHTV